jgi:hypothetical protein
VPFVRFSRDRRGYEHTYLIHAAPRRGAPTRILYWYRTPPGIRVGREAFDLEARRMLEAQYPSVSFDWPKLLETPMPPPDAENWRERRRVERSARQARQTEEPEDATVEPRETADPPRPLPVHEAVAEAPSSAAESAEADASGIESANRKRRRRGGRRRRRPNGGVEANGSPEQASETDTDPTPQTATPNAETAALPSPVEPDSDQEMKASD